MKWKIMSVAFVIWIVGAAAGGFYGRVEQWLNNRPDLLELKHLQSLYGSGLIAEARDECARAGSNPAYAQIKPDILYMQWAISRRDGRWGAAIEFRRTFVERYPHHQLEGYMLFADAADLLAKDKFDEAKAKLHYIAENYSRPDLSDVCRETLAELDRANAIHQSVTRKSIVVGIQ